MIYEVVKRTWTFDDCIVEEKEGNGFENTYFDVHVERDGIKGHQLVVPLAEDVDECRRHLDEGESPLYVWEDGMGHVVGECICVSRDLLRRLILDSKYVGGGFGTYCDMYQFEPTWDGKGKKFTVYTHREMNCEEDSVDDLVEAAVSFAVGTPMNYTRWEVEE